ncbi:MAG: acyl--CoA ligase [Gemmatimonadota bacterium]|uniref:acyl--CoA ligase n=1 Tax=Candidatus Palauibacter scopulicola TaxID=3056741 RepID=UPI0023951097|nr:acyl--CoA ligase [Candidatus Palauibacter scopulicola]MDE2662446.1 acyl--CoA ligase [Candidatus Palauibacter scopulicola]
MPNPVTVWELLAGSSGESPAIAAPGREPLNFDGLRSQVERTVAALNGFGIGRNDRVAIVLPNGPEMASAFVSVACAATAAPLNPAYRQPEHEFYLSDLSAKTLILEAGSDSPARAAAASHGVPVLELHVEAGAPAGTFELVPEGAGEDGTGEGPASRGSAGDGFRGGLAEEGDIALILHTSGTTSRPKIVPLSHRNVCASAVNVRHTLRLTADDCCLNVMPLFHIHGLIAAVLAPLGVGGSIFCTPGFNALRFFGWLAEARPTFYTAVPTMHQAILARAARNRDVIERNPLRFIRSASAALPPQVMAELEEAFGAPVVEAYAMTEAAHQMTCNPLPPAVRKPGTVGIAAGPEVSVMDESGPQLLPAGDVGEIVIRGPNVSDGYENNPAANAEAFTNGWFRTGDQGVMDGEGYVTITGRLKEIINRGGEKVSPREIDEAILDHPAVRQVVAFAMPHPKLGEEIAAAAVLRHGMEATPRELQAFAAERLADFKVPRKILLMDDIPKGPTGKIQRIGMAEKLGLT